MAGILQNPNLVGLPRQAVLGNAWPFSGFLQNVDDTFSRSDSATTWSLSVQKDLSDDVMLYVAAATGYKAGGFNSTSGDTGDMRAFDKDDIATRAITHTDFTLAAMLCRPCFLIIFLIGFRGKNDRRPEPTGETHKEKYFHA